MCDKRQKIYKDRFDNLRNLIIKEFPSDNYEVVFESTISVSYVGSRKGEYKERKPRIKFAPSEELMTDVDNGFENIFQQGIIIAKNILNNPPFPDKNFQGDIVLHNEGASFKKRLQE